MILDVSRCESADGRSLISFLLTYYVAGHDLRPGSIEQKRITIGRLANFLKREPLVSDLNRDTVSRFLAAYACGAQPSTVASKRRDLLALWRYAWEEKILAEPPYRVRPVKVPEREPQGWDLEELRLLLDAAGRLPGKFDNGCSRASVFRALVLTLLSTGLRLRATLSIRFSDVRRDRSFTARWEFAKNRREQTKRLSLDAWQAITECRAQLVGKCERLIPAPAIKALRRWWRFMVITAGLPAGRYAGPQMLRRTAASFKERERPGSAQGFLGHKTPGLAERRYLVPRIVSPEASEPPTLNF